jgi:hypothetical protein
MLRRPVNPKVGGGRAVGNQLGPNPSVIGT